MKVAVLISGLCESKNINTSLAKNNQRIRDKFPDADFYYGSYTQYRDTFNQHFNARGHFFNEPVLHYHPYYMPKQYWESNRYNETRQYIQQNTKRMLWSAHHTKQHLTHSRLCDIINTEAYDVIVRARFDTWISHKANFTEYLESCYNDNMTYGFSGTKWRNGLDKLRKIETSPFSRNYNWLFDQLIIYPAHILDTSYVYELNDQKRLLPAEMGWWQILSKVNGNRHKCLSGWANHDKHVLKEDFI